MEPVDSSSNYLRVRFSDEDSPFIRRDLLKRVPGLELRMEEALREASHSKEIRERKEK